MEEIELPHGKGTIWLSFEHGTESKDDNVTSGRLMLQHREGSGKLTWTRHITAESQDDVIGLPAGLGKAPVEYFPGFGYKLNLFATWTYGTEAMTVYLKKDATLRFYFLSW